MKRHEHEKHTKEFTKFIMPHEMKIPLENTQYCVELIKMLFRFKTMEEAPCDE